MIIRDDTGLECHCICNPKDFRLVCCNMWEGNEYSKVMYFLQASFTKDRFTSAEFCNRVRILMLEETSKFPKVRCQKHAGKHW